jgi:hypothetical protein
MSRASWAGGKVKVQLHRYLMARKAEDRARRKT